MFFGSTLAPWPNRLANHSYEFQGKRYQTPNVDQDGNSNHGLVFNRAFEVNEHSDDSISFGYKFGSDESYPFPIDLKITYQLFDSGLRVSAIATNNGQLRHLELVFTLTSWLGKILKLLRISGNKH